MSLLELKKYLMEVKVASLTTICAYFKSDADMLQQMLAYWVRKGCVRQCKKTSNCGVKCTQCSLAAIEMYEWIF